MSLLEKIVERHLGLNVVPIAVVLEPVCTNWQPYIYWFPKLSNFMQLWKRIAMFANAQGGDPHHNTLRKICVTVHKPHIKTDQPPMPSGKSFNLGQDADKAEI